MVTNHLTHCVERIGTVQSRPQLRHTHACMTSMTSMSWLLRQSNSKLLAFTLLSIKNIHYYDTRIKNILGFEFSNYSNELETQLLINLHNLPPTVPIPDHGFKTCSMMQAQCIETGANWQMEIYILCLGS
jgi:hypothetical protein